MTVLFAAAADKSKVDSCRRKWIELFACYWINFDKEGNTQLVLNCGIKLRDGCSIAQ